jgi:malonate transporter
VEGVFEGFATIGILIGLGILLAHLGVIDAAGQRTLSTLAFYVASPALLVTVLESSDLTEVFSGNLVATAGAVLVTGLIYVVVAAVRRQELGATVVGTLCSAYVNGGNLGLPIAAYVLGDPALVAPVLLLQLLLLQPLALVLLDVDTSPTRLSVGKVLMRPLTNPITIGSFIGLLLAVTDTGLPSALHDPLVLVSGMAVPSMLLAYGVSLRLGPLPGRGVPAAELGLVVGLKMVVQPIAAYAIGRYAVGLDTPALLAVTVLSALPTAQNVFIIASRYERSALLARDAIFVSTIASVPLVILITVLIV